MHRSEYQKNNNLRQAVHILKCIDMHWCRRW